MTKSRFHLDELALDTFREIANIGVGHAATALSKMLSEAIQLEIPSVFAIPVEEIPEVAGGAETMVAGVRLTMSGEVSGSILILFPEASAWDLLHKLTGVRLSSTTQLTEESASALREIGNILASAYLNAVGKLLDVVLRPSVPGVAFDMTGAVVDGIVIELSAEGEQVMVVETGLAQETGEISGRFFLLLGLGAAEAILDKARSFDG